VRTVTRFHGGPLLQSLRLIQFLKEKKPLLSRRLQCHKKVQSSFFRTHQVMTKSRSKVNSSPIQVMLAGTTSTKHGRLRPIRKHSRKPLCFKTNQWISVTPLRLASMTLRRQRKSSELHPLSLFNGCVVQHSEESRTWRVPEIPW